MKEKLVNYMEMSCELWSIEDMRTPPYAIWYLKGIEHV